MTKQEYRTIRDMSWLILINSKTNSILQENGFTWSELGEDYVRRIKNIGGV